MCACVFCVQQMAAAQHNSDNTQHCCICSMFLLCFNNYQPCIMILCAITS